MGGRKTVTIINELGNDGEDRISSRVCVIQTLIPNIQ
jgi:hypothetical protein